MKKHIAVLVLSLVIAAVFPALAHAAYDPPALKVAVVQSTLSDAWQARHRKGWACLLKQQKTTDYLRSRGWDVTVLSDADVGNLATLKQYDVVVLPYVFAMNAGPSKTLLRYVAEGGGLVSAFGSPRVAPEKEIHLSDPNEVWPEHWVHIYNYEGWEWGPLTEAYQTTFIDDVGAMKFTVTPPNVSHPIVSGARGILRARGYSDSRIGLVRDPAAWVELPRMLKGNANAVPFLNMDFTTTPTGSNSYPGTHPAAVASEYLKGRAAYFYFSPMDFLPNFNQDNLARIQPSTGTPQTEVGAAYLESAIVWAAQDDGKTGPIVRAGRTNGVITASRSGIYASQYVTNAGNVTVGGNVIFRIWDPSGRLVHTSTRSLIGVVPGGSNRYSQSWVPGSLKAGKYKVQVEYQTSYTDNLASSYKECAWVTSGQGAGIKTVTEGVSRPVSSRVGFSPYLLQPDGDGWADKGYMNFTLDKPAMVIARVYNMRGGLVYTLANGTVYGAGANSIRLAPGTTLPDGTYSFSIKAYNSAGVTSASSILFSSKRLSTAPALGTTPVLSGVGATPNPFSPNGDGTADASDISYTLSADAWVTVRIFDSRGEIRTLTYNNKRTAGANRETWNGRTAAGLLAGNGTYRYYVFAHSGSRVTNAFAWGSVTVKR